VVALEERWREMRTLRKRLDDLEERKAFREFIEDKRQFKGRSQDELRFFSAHGYFPEAAGEELPDRQEFTVGGIRTTINTERVDIS
jgi:hypothetical protein